MIDSELLQILCCPETHQSLKPADAREIEGLNQRIRAGTLKNRAGTPVVDAIDGGLIREDGRYLYVIRQNIPVMLVDEAIPLN